jgi:hypothetical protein
MSFLFLISTKYDQPGSEAGFLLRVHPEPCPDLCSSKSKFISAQTLILLVLDKKPASGWQKLVWTWPSWPNGTSWGKVDKNVFGCAQVDQMEPINRLSSPCLVSAGHRNIQFLFKQEHLHFVKILNTRLRDVHDNVSGFLHFRPMQCDYTLTSSGRTRRHNIRNY